MERGDAGDNSVPRLAVSRSLGPVPVLLTANPFHTRSLPNLWQPASSQPIPVKVKDALKATSITFLLDPSKPVLQSDTEFSQSPTPGMKKQNFRPSSRSAQRKSSYKSLTSAEKLKYGPNCPNNVFGYKEMSKYLGGAAHATVQVTTWTMGPNPTPTEQEIQQMLFHGYEVDMHAVSIKDCSWPNFAPWEQALRTGMCPDYTLIQSEKNGSLYHSVSIRRNLIWFVSGIPTHSKLSLNELLLMIISSCFHLTDPKFLKSRTSCWNVFRTEEAVGIAIGFFGCNLLFVGVHLAHGNDTAKRTEGIEKLCKTLSLKHGNFHEFDGVFFSGDFQTGGVGELIEKLKEASSLKNCNYRKAVQNIFL